MSRGALLRGRSERYARRPSRPRELRYEVHCVIGRTDSDKRVENSRKIAAIEVHHHRIRNEIETGMRIRVPNQLDYHEGEGRKYRERPHPPEVDERLGNRRVGVA